MYELTIYPPAFGEPSGSPFCVKAMILCDLAGIDWKPDFSGDPRKAPKGKLPVLRAGDQIIPDSDQIRDYLEQEHGVDFDAGLDNAQRATSRAIIRMMEEHFYFAVVCDRWVDDANWPIVRETYFSMIPSPLRRFVTNGIRKGAFRDLSGQGMGRHSEEERLVRITKDLKALENLLDNQPYLFGDTPTAADATVVAMLSAALATPVATPIVNAIHNSETLNAYAERGRRELYARFNDRAVEQLAA